MKNATFSQLNSIVTGMLAAKAAADIVYLADEFLACLDYEVFDSGCGIDGLADLMQRSVKIGWSTQALSVHVTDQYHHHIRLKDHIRRAERPILWNCKAAINVNTIQPGSGILSPSQFPTTFHPGKFGMISYNNGFKILSPSPNCVAAASLIGSAMSLFHDDFNSENSAKKRNLEILASLSEPQRIVLHWMTLGKTNYEISVIMAMPVRRVEYYVSQLIDRYQVNNRLQVVLKCL